MARLAIAQAQAQAQTVEQLRQAQAVVLPLDYRLSLVDTAAILGLSPYWVCRLRRHFMQGRIAGAPAMRLQPAGADAKA